MKKNYLAYLIALIMIIGVITACNQNVSNKNKEEEISTEIVKNPNTASGENNGKMLPKFEFEKEEHDFGKIYQGEKVSYAFKFKNTGNADLLISKASASCGCTIPSYSEVPIPPNGEGIINVSFNSEGRKGFQTKEITIIANTQPNTKVLTIKSMVVVPEE